MSIRGSHWVQPRGRFWTFSACGAAAGHGRHRDGRTHHRHEHEPVRPPPRAAYHRVRHRPPAEAALHAAQEHLAAVEHALVEAHEALDAIARELVTAPAGSAPDALTTAQPRW